MKPYKAYAHIYSLDGGMDEITDLLLLQPARRACIPIQRLERQSCYPQLYVLFFP